MTKPVAASASIAAVITIVLLLGMVFVLQRRLVFPGSARVPARALGLPPASAQQIWLETADGSIEAWFGSSPATRGPALIFAHGNGELIDDWPEPFAPLVERGVSVLLVEYPGYGYSEGSPSRASLRRAFLAGHTWLIQQPEVDPDRIVAMGRSLGGAVAADLDSEVDLAGLVLLSTFSSMRDIAWELNRLPGFLVRDRFDTAAVVLESDTPVLILHGSRDELIPIGHSERIAAQREGLEVVQLDCGHNDCLEVWGEIVEQVVAFVDRIDAR